MTQQDLDRATLRALTDFPAYAEDLLYIRAKDGRTIPLVLNEAQQYIHSRLEAQLKDQGFVRALILKGRQQGCSTYVGGRYYRATSTRRGVRTFILAHEAEASGNLFEMANRYHEHMHPEFKPHTSASNARELVFDKLDSGYKVGTAGTKGIGRSATVQYFHGSEVAFWPHADEHAAGIMQTVPMVPGSEIIFESTANGMGNYFHKQWRKATSGRSEFIAIFVPWYWQSEYRTPVPPGFVLDEEEAEYMTTYGLDLEQMAWRRVKIIELDDPLLFKQEYPATADEAFQTTGVDSYIAAHKVQACRRNPIRVLPGQPVVAGYDPKRDGDDRGAFIYRQGMNWWGLEYNEWDEFTTALGFLKRKLDSAPYIAMLFIDYGGSGWELGQMLISMGYGARVRVVNFGANALSVDVYGNKRSEMWAGVKAALYDQDVPAHIPDDDDLQADLCGPSFGYDNRTRLILESKQHMKARGVDSSDGADAMALTLAEPVAAEVLGEEALEDHAADRDYDPLEAQA